MSPWESSVQQYVDDCAEGRLYEPRTALAVFAELRNSAPKKYAGLFDQPVAPARLEELYEARAYVSAAMELVGPYCGVLVTRAASGPSSALVSFSGEIEEGNFFGEDPAIALVAACARALLLLGGAVAGTSD
ncbi:hypothetical protein [Qipengyuania qiaonensis]|uniref:Uncharacterized protein n=1 Tax=Qipengyuania qiaonensis TaxID=2867240 RepID=A0ABS7J7N0_9SPHN|nr:hypothetical protein [Qipengyuania qiaonensis]MBX7481889.1 hypothetical protein [Qipengyuania qiaonensis]